MICTSVLDTIAGSAARLCEANNAAIASLDGDTYGFVSTYGPTISDVLGRHSPLDGDTVTSRALLERQTIHVHDLASDAGYARGREVARSLGYRTVVATPLLREGAPVGALIAVRTEARPFSAAQIKLLETFADQAAIAIENVRLFQELQERVEELQALGEVGQTVSATLDLGRVLETVVTQADRLSGTDGGVLFEYDEASHADRAYLDRLGGYYDDSYAAIPPGTGR